MSENVIDLRSLRIAVLLGGASAERQVSLHSGEAVAAALGSRGHRVRCIDPAQTELSTVDWPRFDAAFIALHGRFGEDGQIQSLFESWGVPYTGSRAAASRLAFSKSAAKERFCACGVPTPPYVLIHESDGLVELRRVAERIGYPLVMKPDASGSSLGVSLVKTAADLPAAVARCFAEGPFGLLEQAIPGTEWTVGFVDEEPLPLIRIDAQGEFFDFAAKYEDEATGYCLEPHLPSATRREIELVAAAAVSAVGVQGISRVDLRLDPTNRPWVLEVNTVPGFTDHSLVPKAAAHAGLSLGELCERAIHCGLQSHRESRQNEHNRPTRPNSDALRHAG